MGITVKWDDDSQTIIYIQCIGEWTEQEGLRAVDEIARLIDSVAHPVYGINDFRDSEAPLSVNGLKFVQILRKRIPLRDSLIVMVGAQPFVVRVMDIAKRIYKDIPGRMLFAQTPEEARALIAQHQTAKKELDKQA